LKAAGCERFFKEKVTGATADRPQLKKLLREVDHGDVVIVAAVDRLSRDTTDLMVIARDLHKAGAGLRSLAEPVVDTTSDFAELVLAMLGVFAKLERRRIKERTARGRAEAWHRPQRLRAHSECPRHDRARHLPALPRQGQAASRPLDPPRWPSLWR
jgi:DNA invertase Pin-like site-specific DNA recombinase